jgi:segregation and condensation protein B
MSVKAKLEAIIYATEEPVTVNHLAGVLKDAVLAELYAEEQSRLALNEVVAEPTSPEAELDEETVEFGEPSEAAPAAEATPSDSSGTDQAVPIADVQVSEKEELRRVKDRISFLLDELVAEYSSPDRGMEIRQIAGGYRMATKPEHHDVVVSFAKSLKPPVRLSLQALETLSVIAYKQPVTVPEISEIRGVDSAGVIATLLDRKLITTAGRKQVIGRPILYKTTKEFLLRFGLNDVGELPSMEEFEKLGDPQAELFEPANETPLNAPAAAEDSVPDASETVPEADPALASTENSGNQAPAEVDPPERFNEAIAPLPEIDEPGEPAR